MSSKRSHCPDFHENALGDLIADLIQDNFEPYHTSVGGSGLGILSPYGEHYTTRSRPPATVGPVTPPETPDAFAKDEDALESLRADFKTKDLSDLAKWAEARGRWLYV
jgi:hypothetical protein